MAVFAAIILLIFCVIGFAAIFFTTFGTLIILVGSVLYAAMTNFMILNLKALIFITVLYLIGEGLEYLLIIAGAKKMGASNLAVVGAVVGGSVGAMIGTLFLGVGIFVGMILGIFLGAFLVEFALKKDLMKSLKAGTGGVLGRLGSIAAKVAIAAGMIYIIISRIINYM